MNKKKNKMTVDKFGRYSNRAPPRGPRGSKGERGLPGPTGEGFLKTESGDYDIGFKRLTNIQEPQEQKDAANKKYVDKTYEQLREYIQIEIVQKYEKLFLDTINSNKKP